MIICCGHLRLLTLDLVFSFGTKFLLMAATLFAPLQAQSPGLQTSFDESGLATLSFNGVSLVDVKAKRGEAFSVGSYQVGTQEGYGAAEKKASWNAAARTITWTLPWGTVACQFSTSKTTPRLDLKIAIHNAGREAVNGINIYPLGLQFPELPKGFGAPNYPQFHNNLDGPALITADYQSGLAAFLETSAKPLYLGLAPSGAANHYQLQVGTINDNSEGFLSKAVPLHRAIAPGQTDTYDVSLRFAASGTPPASLAADVLQTYGTAWPQRLDWKDRGPIGELFVSDPTPAPIPDTSPNPRNYNFAKGINVSSDAGKAAFREALLAYADRAVKLLKSMNAQGAFLWDLEGQQFPQPDTSYAGDPANLPRLSPEMDRVADAFFKRFTDAGLKCGLTIRPQQLDFSASPPRQKDLPAAQQASNMIDKMRYARKRWGCTMFYVDSDGGPNDATAPSVFAAVLKALPEVLIVPENIWPQDYAVAAPLASFTAPYKPLHTPSLVKAIWPRSFSVTYVGDAPGGDLKRNDKNPGQWAEFQEASKKGDILTFRAWFDDQPLNTQVRQLAGK